MLWASLEMTIGMPNALGRGAGHVVQVEPVGIGVQFQHLAVVAGRLEHGFQIDLVRLAAIDQPAGGMGDGRDVRIFQRVDARAS